MLKLFYATEAEVPADLKHLYKQAADGWHLQVEGGAVPRAKLDEFRTNNTEMQNKLRAAEDRLREFDGIDPQKARDLMGRAAEIENGELLKKGDVEKVKEGVRSGLVADHERQLKAVKDELEETKRKLQISDTALSAQVIDNSLMIEARKVGLQDGADAMLLPYARQVWRLEGGKPVAYGPEGKEYGRNGDPITVVEWLERFSQGPGKALFKPSEGSTTGPGNGGNGSSTGQSPTNTGVPYTGGKNPWAKGSINITDQGKIVNSNRAEALRLCAAAGVKPNF